MGKWLVTGAEGFLGSHLCSYLAQRHEVLGTHKPGNQCRKTISSRPLNVIFQEDIVQVLSEFRPDTVVHLAGSKDVNWCEQNPQDAHTLNAESARYIASACQKTGSFLIFLSSDYVFEGTQGNYTLQSERHPLTVYGKTKLDAEDILTAMNISFAVVRTAGVYARANPPASLLGWARNSLENGQEVSAFENVFNSPTFVGDLIQAIEAIGTKRMTGLFHLAGASRESRHSFLTTFARQFGFPEELITKSFYVPGKDARRPLDISLNSTLSYCKIGFEFSDAVTGLKRAFDSDSGRG